MKKKSTKTRFRPIFCVGLSLPSALTVITKNRVEHNTFITNKMKWHFRRKGFLFQVFSCVTYVKYFSNCKSKQFFRPFSLSLSLMPFPFFCSLLLFFARFHSFFKWILFSFEGLQIHLFFFSPFTAFFILSENSVNL